MSRLIDDLFELAQIDAGALTLDKRPVALQEIAADVVDAMQAQAGQAGVTLALDVSAATPLVLLDGARMERVTANLVRNALKHTPSGGRVEVRVFAEDGVVAVRVEDSGEGIEASDLERIWDRFYRVDKSRRRGAGAADGAGLGLAIVRGIVEAHGGTVEVAPKRDQGAAFTARLPRD